MSEENSQMGVTNQDTPCEKCGDSEGIFIQLQCGHIFCMLCATFMYAKSRKFLSKENFIRCFKCEAVTKIKQKHLKLINEVLQNQVLPQIDSLEKIFVPTNHNSMGRQYLQTIGRKIKSQEHSFELQGTPSTNKCFFSKCQSPCSKKKIQQHSELNNTCVVHNNQPITHVCFSCSIQPLCIKCVTNCRRHSGHDLKEINKGVGILMEQLSQTQIQLHQRIEQMQMIQRRLEDRSTIIKDRGSKYMMDLRDGFAQLLQKLQEKSQEVMNTCQQHFTNLIEQINQENQKISLSTQLLKNCKEKISVIQRNSVGLNLVNKFIEIKHEMGHFYHHNFTLHQKKKIQMPSSSISGEITDVAHRINSMIVEFKYSNFCRIGISDLENCTSECKIKKQSESKRIKTNFVSLNSSRDKKQKKNTKTEEDEKRLKNHKINSKVGEKDHRKGKVPTYISDYINKKGNDGSSCRMEMTSPNFENTSKVTSKLSKTISPEDIVIKKKKDKTSMIKQRIERKITLPSGKVSSKRKKVH